MAHQYGPGPIDTDDITQLLGNEIPSDYQNTNIFPDRATPGDYVWQFDFVTLANLSFDICSLLLAMLLVYSKYQSKPRPRSKISRGTAGVVKHTIWGPTSWTIIFSGTLVTLVYHAFRLGTIGVLWRDDLRRRAAFDQKIRSLDGLDLGDSKVELSEEPWVNPLSTPPAVYLTLSLAVVSLIHLFLPIVLTLSNQDNTQPPKHDPNGTRSNAPVPSPRPYWHTLLLNGKNSTGFGLLLAILTSGTAFYLMDVLNHTTIEIISTILLAANLYEPRTVRSLTIKEKRLRGIPELQSLVLVRVASLCLMWLPDQYAAEILWRGLLDGSVMYLLKRMEFV